MTGRVVVEKGATSAGVSRAAARAFAARNDTPTDGASYDEAEAGADPVGGDLGPSDLWVNVAFDSACAPNLRHLGHFLDHARLEPMLYEGVPVVGDGRLAPNSSGHGYGLGLRADAARFRVA